MGHLVDPYDHQKFSLGFRAVGSTLAVLAEFVLPPLVLFPVLLVLGGSLWGLNPARDAIVSDIASAAHEGRTFGYLGTGELVLSSAAPAVVRGIGDTVGLHFAFLLVAGLVVTSAISIVGRFSNRVYVGSRHVDHSEMD